MQMGAIESTREFAELHSLSLATLPREERHAVIQDLTEKIFEEIPAGTDVICTGQNICTFEMLEKGKAESLGIDNSSPDEASMGLSSTTESAAHGTYNGLELFWAEDLGQPEAIGQLVIGHVLLGSKITYGLEKEISQISFCPVLDAELTAFENPAPASYLGPEITSRVDKLLNAEIIDFAELDKLFKAVTLGKGMLIVDFLNYLNEVPVSARLRSIVSSNLFWGEKPALFLDTCIDEDISSPFKYESAEVDLQLGPNAIFNAGHAMGHENFLIVQTERVEACLFMPVHLISGYFKR